MEESVITEEIGRDSRLGALFFLRVIFLLSIEMRWLLAAEEMDWERVRTINQINHRLVPAVEAAVEQPDAPMAEHFRGLLDMLADCGFSQMMRDAFNEVRISVSEVELDQCAAMSPDLSAGFEHLRQGGWHCIENTVPIEWPAAIGIRYPWIPGDVREAMAGLMEVISPDQKCWLLTSREYAGDSDSAFAWNEWEQQSMEAAGDDLEWGRQIETFWDKHLPIALSVRDGYAYFALREDGSVVQGQEPDFEGTVVVASSYESFIDLLAAGAGKGCQRNANSSDILEL